MIPEYCTGMSHPPKSTILAPSARWTEFRGVVRRAGAAGMQTQANSTGQGCQFRLPGAVVGQTIGLCGLSFPVKHGSSTDDTKRSSVPPPETRCAWVMPRELGACPRIANLEGWTDALR